MKVKDFFSNEYVNYASYDNIRKIASYIDGQKNSSRKVLYYTLNNPRKPERVDIFSNKVVAYSLYIHGDISGVVVSMAKNYTGSNNLNLLDPLGKFGKRLNTEASAIRYIQTQKSKITEALFRSEDNPIIEYQEFEGYKIEPRYYLPLIPLLLVNGSQAPSVGFAQKILPKNPIDIIDSILNYLKTDKLNKRILPFYKGFDGVIESVSDSPKNVSYVFKGKVDIGKSRNSFIITELPIGYDNKKYVEELIKLKEAKVIQKFRDLSDTKKDKFLFEVTFPYKVFTSLKSVLETEPDKVLTILKLIKKDTENYTCIDENNKITFFENELDLIKRFVEFRLSAYEKRKSKYISKIENDIEKLKEKLRFVNDVINNKIKLNISKSAIIDYLENNNYKKFDESNDYSYLLNIKIYEFSSDDITDLENKIKAKENEVLEYSKKDVKDIYTEELKDLKKVIKKEFKGEF